MLSTPILPGSASANEHEPEPELPAAFWKRVDHNLWQTTTPNDLNDVHFPDQNGCDTVSGTCVGYAVGEVGTLLKTDDGGESWSAFHVSTPVPDLHGVHFVDTDTGFVVGDEGTIIRIEDGGDTWVWLESGTEEHLSGVGFVDADTGFAVGGTAGMVVLGTADGGENWKHIEAGEFAHQNAAYDVHFDETGRVYVASATGSNFPVVLETDNDDGGWTRTACDNRFAPCNRNGRLFGIGGESGTAGDEAADGIYGVGSGGTILRSDGEGTWKDVSPVLPGMPDARRERINGPTFSQGIDLDYRGVAFTDAVTGYVIGDLQAGADGGRFPVILHTEDGFDTPPRVEPIQASPAPGDEPVLQAVDAPSDTVAVGVGASGLILKRSTDAGAWVEPADYCLPSDMAEQFPDDLVCPEPPAPLGPVDVVDHRSPGPPLEIDQATHECDLPSNESTLEEESGDAHSGLECLAEFEWVFETGDTAAFNPLGLDPALRRLVGYWPGDNNNAPGPRVLLYDVDALEQRGVRGFGAPFRAASAHGANTGVVNLHHAAAFADIDIFRTESHTRALDTDRHRLFIGNDGSGIGDTGTPQIGVVSLVGEFEPTLIDLDALLVDTPPRAFAGTGLAGLAVDARNNVVYVLTDRPLSSTTYSGAIIGEQAVSRGLVNQQVTLHAFTPRVSGQGALDLERAWSLPLEERCRGAESPQAKGQFRFLGVSHDGRTIAFPCVEVSFGPFGTGQAVQASIFNVVLPEGVDPAAAGDHRTGIGYVNVPMPGSATGVSTTAVVRGAPGAEILHWRSGARNFFWHYGLRQFFGEATIEPGSDGDPFLVAEDPGSGRLYLSGGEISSSADEEEDEAREGSLALLQTVNLGDTMWDGERVPTGVEKLGRTADFEFGPAGVVDPETRRLFVPATTDSGRRVVVLEDQVDPTLPLALTHPDEFTHDIDEADAASISRRGETAAYGARVWWSGLRGALPGTNEAQPDGTPNPQIVGDPDPVGGYTYPQMFEDHGVTSPFLSNLPWRPSDFRRVVFSARVPDTSLKGGFVPALSSARALALSLDDTEQRDQPTRDDLTGRLGAGQVLDSAQVEGNAACGEWSLAFDARPPEEFKEPCQSAWSSLWDGFREESGEEREEFERCSLEAHDRLMREFDGEWATFSYPDEDDDGDARRPCFEELDRNDPDWNEKTGENDRPGLERRVGWTRASRCADPSDDDDRRFDGSVVVCDAEGWRTEASARGGFAFDLPGAAGPVGSVRVGASFSATRSYLDAKLGMTSEAVAVASDVEVSVPGRGTLRIGEVRTTARSWAKGRPGSAGSALDVGYHDVTVERATSTDGGVENEETVVFSCGPSEAQIGGTSVAAPDDVRKEWPSETPRDAPEDPACDPEVVTEAVARVFGQTLQARAPARDTEDATTGSPGGVQAIVRRNRADFWEDSLLFGVKRDEVPGLQLTVVSDGLRFNRYKIDLAAVFVESWYEIGERRIDMKAPPGSLVVELADPTGTPLADGHFLVAADDGPVRECTTGSDGVGSCRFGNLAAGQYEVRQLVAPSGFAPQAGAARAFVSPGSQARVRFVNVRNAGAVDVTLVNPAGQPLEGGAFELTATEGGGTHCETGVEGRCLYSPVPLAAYQLTQTATPPGYEPADPVDFVIARPGQVARIEVVNGRAGSTATVRIIEIIEDAEPTVMSGSPPRSFLDRLADAWGFLLRSPLQAILFALLVGLFATPAYLYWRSRRYQHAFEHGAFTPWR